MTLLAVGDVVWQALIAAVVTIVMAWIGRVATVKLNAIAKTGDAVHTLVNSNFGTQLRISAIALRRLAEMTNSTEDIEAAELADKLVKEHEAKQDVVDEKAKHPPQPPD